MPEGDTIFRAARALHGVLAGKTVTRFESAFPALNRIAEDRPIVGRTIVAVESRGKHILMTFSGDLALRTHMKMNGAWHLYHPGEPWQRSVRDMRIVIATADAVAVGFNVPIAELLTGRDEVHHRELSAMGPDLLADPPPSSDEILVRMRATDGVAIADVLLNQRVVAGIGNVFK